MLQRKLFQLGDATGTEEDASFAIAGVAIKFTLVAQDPAKTTAALPPKKFKNEPREVIVLVGNNGANGAIEEPGLAGGSINLTATHGVSFVLVAGNGGTGGGTATADGPGMIGGRGGSVSLSFEDRPLFGTLTSATSWTQILSGRGGAGGVGNVNAGLGGASQRGGDVRVDYKPAKLDTITLFGRIESGAGGKGGKGARGTPKGGTGGVPERAGDVHVEGSFFATVSKPAASRTLTLKSGKGGEGGNGGAGANGGDAYGGGRGGDIHTSVLPQDNGTAKDISVLGEKGDNGTTGEILQQNGAAGVVIPHKDGRDGKLHN